MSSQEPRVVERSTPPPGFSSPRALKWMAVFRWALVVLSLAAAVFAWRVYLQPSAGAGEHATYQCPMHPQVVSPDRGDCPICHMALEPVTSSRAGAAAPASASPAAAPAVPSSAAAAAGRYICPMHPEVKSDTPGQCPLCKMDLELQQPAAAEGGSSPALPAEVVAVELELDRAQAIGVRVASATSGPGEASLRVTANVAAREGSTVEVRARAAGFVERLFVAETGTRVQRGQPLLALYSPEIYQAFSDWSLARGWALGDPKAAQTLAVVERRLELLGVSSQTLQQARESQEVPRTIPLSAPATGFVLEKNVALGGYVTPETLLYRVVDLAQVFVIADVPSSDAAQVVRGQKARFHPASRAERVVEGEVDLVYPSVAGEARTLRLRLSVDNRKLGLMPGEYGTLELALGATKLVWVPRDALIDTGLSRYVFIESRPGRYEPRAVTTGAATPDRVSIAKGVAPGERVVSGATFLLDAESRLRAALSPRASEPAAAQPAAPAGQP